MNKFSIFLIITLSACSTNKSEYSCFYDDGSGPIYVSIDNNINIQFRSGVKSEYLITSQDENTIEGYHKILGYVVFHKKLETLYQKTTNARSTCKQL
ncbi:MAG: hypothetical protein VW689_03745 [Gammaproteobacteria bacterium]